MRSMTGYGAGAAEARGCRVSVEIRGVNQRFLDVRVNAPREYGPWESLVRERVLAAAARGRIEVTVVRAAVAARRRYRVAVRAELARAYVGAARGLVRSLGLEGGVSLADLLRLPDLFEVIERPPDVRPELRALRRALATALRAFDAERRREGARLKRDMQARVARLRRATVAIRRRVPHLAAERRRQMEARLDRLVGAPVEPARLAQEMALLADRGDVTEELVRLESHIAALAAALAERGPVGKRIEFLLQEIHRELNTTGAKAGDLAIGDVVLAAKGELEKLREQVQNVE